MHTHHRKVYAYIAGQARGFHCKLKGQGFTTARMPCHHGQESWTRMRCGVRQCLPVCVGHAGRSWTLEMIVTSIVRSSSMLWRKKVAVKPDRNSKNMQHSTAIRYTSISHDHATMGTWHLAEVHTQLYTPMLAVCSLPFDWKHHKHPYTLPPGCSLPPPSQARG